jgi:hypothetical protein
VNDLLFQGVSRKELAALSQFLSMFALNSEYALAEIRRSEGESRLKRGTRGRI